MTLNRAGGFTVPALPTAFRALEIAEILRIANSKAAALPWLIGFEVAPARDDADLRRFLTEIRAIPRDARSRVEFRYALPLAESGRGSFADRAWDMLGSAHLFHATPRHRELGDRARSLIELTLAGSSQPAPPRLLATGVTFDFRYEEPGITADLEMLGDDLMVGVERISADDLSPIERQALRLVEAHQRRWAARERCRLAHASGWIDQTALQVLSGAGTCTAEAIRLVQREGLVEVPLKGSSGEALDGTLIQLDGRIEGWITPRAGNWCLKHQERSKEGLGDRERRDRAGD